MDLRLRGQDGITATRKILADRPATRVLALTTYDGDESIHRALEAGARGYLTKDFGPGVLIAAIRAVAAGHRYIPAEVAARLAADGSRILLTGREAAVLRLLAEGLRNKEIAARIGVGKETARTHVANLMSKFGCSDRGRVIAMAIARGFLAEAGFAREMG